MTAQSYILLVGGDEHDRASAAAIICAAGLDAVVSRSSLALAAGTLLPSLVIIVGDEVAALCGEARGTPALADVPLLAAVAPVPTDAVATVLAAGADDVVLLPLHPAVVGARARGLIRGFDQRRRARLIETHHEALLNAGALASRGDAPDVLRDRLLIAAEVLDFDRVSLFAHAEHSPHGYIIAATDEPHLTRFTIALEEYPELGAALASAAPVLIANASSDPLTAEVAGILAYKGVGAIAVFPVAWHGRIFGALHMRRARSDLHDLDEERLQFATAFARQTAAQLGQGQVMESLREQTHRLSRARYEATRRLRTIDSLKEHFEAAADGVVVLDEAGRILFVNGTAEDITGFARDGLMGSSLLDLVAADQRDALAEVISSVLGGQNIEAFDLDLSTTSGAPICVSVTTSTVLARSGAVILSFRDVTQERALEVELRKTKEFLERLIDSTVDAIVAADLRGNVILFNQGAERLFGYTASSVIGQLPVWSLYPEAVPRQIMRMLRSTSYGGVGRLEQTRREVRSKSGELVPVNMTASIIYEDHHEVATVGIFSDLRDRIRIEQRLLQAQEKLQLSEKQALVAELAGAAAHELNQPLTSIIGYTQLIERQSEKDARHLRATEIIMREAERMAELVKKIGRITKYETKQYVGSASILDLDKSAAHSSPSLVLPLVEESAEDSQGDDLTGEHVHHQRAATIDHLDLGEVLGADEERSERAATEVDVRVSRGEHGQ